MGKPESGPLPMTRVGISEFRRHLRFYLAKVRAGEHLVITRRGRVVARIAAPDWHDRRTGDKAPAAGGNGKAATPIASI